MSDQMTAGMAPKPMPPDAQMMMLATGFFASAAIYVATKLAVPDLLADGPKSAAELSAATNTDEHSLYRTLRSIASIGVFAESEGRTFANTPMSETLRSDVPNSTRDMVIWLLEEPHWRVYGELLYSVQTGKTAWDKVHGGPIFETLFNSQRELGAIFNRAMTSFSRQTIPAILAAYDFSGAATIADIGGGVGHLLGAVLQKYSDVKGVLFEIPPVLEGATAMLDSYGVTERVELVAGDFTAEIPIVADVYMLKHIIHDWYDDKNQKILGNIRDVMPDDAKVLVIDAVVPTIGEPHFSKFLDLEMLMLPGGMERTAEEFESLLTKSGFRLNRIIQTPSPVSIVEAVKA